MRAATAIRAFHMVALAALCAPALAQDAPPAAPATSVDEEIIVRGRTMEHLRHEIEGLENALYKRFNELNSSDDFDIFCFEQAPTGSNIPLRNCQPQFALQADERAARAVLRRMTGDKYPGIPQMYYARMEQKGEQLQADMQRVAREDEQFAGQLTRLAELKERQRQRHQRRADR